MTKAPSKLSALLGTGILGLSMNFHTQAYDLGLQSELTLEQRNAYRVKEEKELSQNKQTALLKLHAAPSSFSEVTVIGRSSYDQYYDETQFEGVEYDVDDHKQDHQIREAYADVYLDTFSIRLGKQQVTWGESDYFRTIDVINSLDLRDFLLSYTENYQQARNTLNMFNVMHQGEIWESQLLFIPDFKANTLPSASADFAPTSLIQLSGFLGAPEERDPDVKAENAAWAFSSKGMFDWGDLGLYGYSGWNPQGVLNANGSAFEFYEREFVGASLSRPLADWVLRTDLSYFFDERSSANLGSGLDFVEHDVQQMLVAADYTAGSLTFSAQWHHKALLDYDANALDREETNAFSVFLSHDFLGDRLRLSYLMLGEKESFNVMNEYRLIYRFNDQFQVNAGVNWFNGDTDTTYGQYENQSRIFSGFKYFL